MVRLAAVGVPGVLRVGRAGPAWRALLHGPPISTSVHGGRVDVRVVVVARPGHPLGPLATQVQSSVGAAIERLLGLELGTVTVLVDGVGS
jgi:uncharacterized alkaline shock family protein YloU